MKYALSVLILFCSCALPAQDTLNIEGKTWVGSLKDGKRNGLWEEYSIDTLLSRGWFRSDNKEGQWEYYGISHYGDNEIIASGSYRNGMKEGEWTHSGGYQYWKGNYVHGKKEGTWLYYDAEIDDNLIMKGNFIGGIAEGVFESYNEDGSVSATGKMIKGQPAGIWRIYNQDGTLSACGELLINPDTVIVNFNLWDLSNEIYRIALDCDPLYSTEDKNGEWKYYWDGTALSATGVYNNGKKEGKWTSFYDNGNIQYTGIYSDGKKEGEWKGWHYDGSLRSIESYVNGLLHGECSYYDGERWSLATGEYSAGNRSGEWSLWSKDSLLMQRAHYDGLPDQSDPKHPALTYGMSGNYCGLEEVKYEVEYMFRNNNLPSANRHGLWEVYHHNGKLKERGGYSHDKYSGRWDKYDDTGELTSIFHYRDGQKDGEFVEFNWNYSQVWRMGVYKDGNRAEYHEFEKGEGMTKEEYLRQKDL
ncbi:MAG: hypothetical protein RBS38_01650 [Bacteroidales bacterium]|jgi:antitoxin component YwqK of YwqJK toxin-antitoxin module|nr:hypothetical protein [Bacteroidales bacterium]